MRACRAVSTYEVVDVWHFLKVVQLVVWGSCRLRMCLQSPCLYIIVELEHPLIAIFESCTPICRCRICGPSTRAIFFALSLVEKRRLDS